ncbi:hypothetical protein BCR43DRAFT_485731 [Syncephalastrum racemosum]|uniref:Mid2 domain-containing protein n=1 Tax=Syncephalastrum racemosum TaxID=13706 RepID=A0A1X2HMX6_SYNRA|nr:hypothetical protein BCR43DRAFT_485731 [Syncephalastrum racemosum]
MRLCALLLLILSTLSIARGAAGQLHPTVILISNEDDASPTVAPVSRRLALPSLSRMLPSKKLQPSEPTPPPLHRRKDDDPSDNDKDKDDRKKKTTVDGHGKTVIVNITTVVIAPSPDPNKVYHDNNTYAHQQEQPHSSKPADPNQSTNNDGEIVDQLQEDQQALSRMVAILSVVGGVGAIAIVATVVIFTRMRMRKKQHHKQDDESTDASSVHTTRSNDNAHTGAVTDAGDPGEQVLPDRPGSEMSSLPVDAPSAPPAPLFFDSASHPPQQMVHNQDRRRRIISMVSQTAPPAPSAPSAKELESPHYQSTAATATATATATAAATTANAANTASFEPSSSTHPSSSSHPPHTYHHQHHHHPQHQHVPPCPHCLHDSLEAPPPAYTPSAPPYSAFPVPESTEDSSRLARRHSQS